MKHDEDRPSLPAELKRRVLVEAGHRCAIHTCRHPDIEIHHILPWAQCKEHRFENLIALCPNCHQRADANRIDRKALRMYKARLAAASRFDEPSAYPFEPAGDGSPTSWRTLALRDVDRDRRFEAELEYPEFEARVRNAEDLNELVEGRVQALLRDFRDSAVDSPDLAAYDYSFQLNSSFSVGLLSPGLVSIRFAVYSYAGGAHGSTQTEALNCALEPFAELALEDLFTNLDLGLARLSDFAVQDLLRGSADRPPRHEECVRRGASPRNENYATVNLVDRGLLVTFDEYQVGSYAEGWSEVLVPYAVVGEALSPFVRERVGIA